MALAAAASTHCTHFICSGRVVQVLAVSAVLSDVQKMFGEWFDDKLVSPAPVAAAAAAALTQCIRFARSDRVVQAPAASAVLSDVPF
jgi:hypothetical protein